jgi:hypothetical protein
MVNLLPPKSLKRLTSFESNLPKHSNAGMAGTWKFPEIIFGRGKLGAENLQGKQDLSLQKTSWGTTEIKVRR